jgi:phenylalanyl-tRNA synthetase beta chain
MKISLSWLRDFLPTALGPTEFGFERLADALTLAGLPTENFEHLPDGDVVMDVEVTSNRGDCLSHVGVAHELAALLGVDVKLPTIDLKDEKLLEAAPTSVAIENPHACFVFTARVIRGVKVGPSPAWLVKRLESVGLRAINNVVDATNYVMFEMGQPSHVFDVAKLQEDRIVVRNAHAGEKLVALDGKTYTLDPSMLVIADAKDAQGIAGIMGGEHSGVTDATTEVLLEVARFDPMTIRKAARKLQISSDACYRFERGIDPDLQSRASARLTQLIIELAGGMVDGPLVVAGKQSPDRAKISLRMSKIKRLLGIEAKADVVANVLSRLGIETKVVGDVVEALCPTRRGDLRIEEDLIEEYARLVGYEHIPTRDSVSIRLSAPDVVRERTDLVRKQLVASGYFESLTFSFVSDTLAKLFTPKGIELLRVEHGVRKADAQLRPSVLPNLIESLKRNQDAGTSGAKLFETASTYWTESKQIVEKRVVALAGDESYASLRGTVEALLAKLDASRAVVIEPTQHVGYGTGACGKVMWGGIEIGHVGVCDRAVADAAGLRTVGTTLPAIAELSLDELVKGVVDVPRLVALPKFPSVVRDLSLVVKDAVRYAQVEQVVGELKLPDLESVGHVTTYRGKPLEKGSKSLSIQLVFRSSTGTLTSESVDDRVKQVIDAAGSKLSATLRA